MKNIKIKKITLQGIKNFKGEDRKVDYYLILPKGDKIYAFTRDYTIGTYSMTRSGIQLENLITTRTKDRSIMNLVKYTKYIMPYLTDEYGLDVA